MDLRESSTVDIPHIIEIEHIPEYRKYIGQWTYEKHAQTMQEAGTHYFLAMNESNAIVGYAILRGVASEHRNLELKRIAVRSPGSGYGRQILKLLLQKAFNEFGALAYGWMYLKATCERSIS